MSGCPQQPEARPQQPETPPPASTAETPAATLVGGDRDAHGCIASAGYAWCERERSCVRPWELAKEKGFANDADSLRRYCEASAQADTPSPAPTGG